MVKKIPKAEKVTNANSKKGNKKENLRKDSKNEIKGKLKRDKENLENIQVEEETIRDEKVLTDAEEKASLEDLKAKYQTVLSEVKEKLKSNLDQNLIKQAIKCLKKIITDKFESSNNILKNENEEFIFLNFILGKLPLKFSMRPVKVELPNNLYGSKFNTQVCLFVKDPKSAFKDLNITSELPFKLKVIDIKTLKLKFSRFQERRNLLKEYELFLCDSKIYMLLKKLLGKPFYVHKKYPVPIKLDYSKPEDCKNEVLSHVEKTTNFYMTHGPNYSIKIGRAVSGIDEILDNINEGVHQVIAHILKWGVEFEE